MMPAAKHGDPQLGVDIHLCVVPPSPSPVPLPTPHTSIIFDPFDYVPFIGATVTVCGMKRAVAGTAGVAIHIPPGFPFAPKLPDKEDELFMGSATVEADGDPFSFLAVPVLSCQVIGMPSPPRPKRKGGPRICQLPLVFNLAIPTNVFIGGPPTISLMGMASKVGFAALGKLAKSKFAKKVGERFQDWRKAKFGHLKPGFLKCTILRAEPVNIVTGAVSVEQEDFTLPGLIPVRWTRRYASDNPRRGACGMGWTCPADARLEHDAESGLMLFHHPEEGIAIFPALPAAEGDAAAVLELMDGALLSDHGTEFRVRTKEDRIYRFPKSYGFDAGGGQREYPLWQLRDLCGNTLTWEREGRRLVAVVESAGRRLEFETGADGLLRQVSLHVPESGFRHGYVRYEQDARGDLVSAVDALGHPYRFAYDRHHMVRHTDRNGLSFHYEYDRSGEAWRVVRSWGDGGLYAYKFAYLDPVNERRITDSLGHVSVVKLDERGLPISEIDPLGGITAYEYDDAGRTTAVVDQDGHRTEYAFDERGNLLSFLSPDGATSTFKVTPQGKVTEAVAPDGATWRQHFAPTGLLERHVGPLGGETSLHYDKAGFLLRAVAPLGGETRLQRDAYGQAVAMTDPLGHVTRFEYDELGNVVTRTDPLGRKTRYEYDAQSRFIRVTRPGDLVFSVGYDAEDNPVALTDEAGRTTHLTRVALTAVKQRRFPDGTRLEYYYDPEERLLAVRNQRGETHRITRDARGRVVRETDYWGQTTSYRYSPAGHLLCSRDADGRQLSYRTDPCGRVLERIQLDEEGRQIEVESFSYDSVGRLMACWNDAIRIERDYDPEGRILRERQGDAFEVAYAYDLHGNMLSRRLQWKLDDVAFSTVANFEYDLLDHVTRIATPGAPPMRLLRDPVGRVVTQLAADGSLRTDFTFNAQSRLAGQETRLGERLLAAQAYSYDAAGNILERRDAQWGTERYGYDPVGALTSHTDAAGNFEQFARDPAGDRLRYAPAEAVGVGEPAQLTRLGVLDEAVYGFDRSGNLVTRFLEGREERFRWDPAGRLRGTVAGGEQATYLYDPLGRRVAKRAGGRMVQFGWDGSLPASEFDGAEAPQARTAEIRSWIYYSETYEPFAMQVARHADEGPAGMCRTYMLQNEPNGAPARAFDTAGDCAWAARYGAWGAAGVQPGSRITQNLRLQGQYEDVETGLHYSRFRYYDPCLGQFISQDPLGLEAGANPYRYAPNVWNWADPLGLAGCKRGPKPKGSGPHNLTIDRRIEELKKELGPDWRHTGGGSLTETTILTPGGKKERRRMDITFENAKTGEKHYENVGRTEKRTGLPVKREREAIADVAAETGVTPKFTAYDK
jgi:RHS repeat-associated protein